MRAAFISRREAVPRSTALPFARGGVGAEALEGGGAAVEVVIGAHLGVEKERDQDDAGTELGGEADGEPHFLGCRLGRARSRSAIPPRLWLAEHEGVDLQRRGLVSAPEALDSRPFDERSCRASR